MGATTVEDLDAGVRAEITALAICIDREHPIMISRVASNDTAHVSSRRHPEAGTVFVTFQWVRDPNPRNEGRLMGVWVVITPKAQYTKTSRHDAVVTVINYYLNI